MSGGSPVGSSRGSGAASPTLVLVIVSAGMVLANLDLFVVNVPLPDMARDLHVANLADLSWVLNGYAIVYAALLVLFGRLAESHRRDRAFLLGVAVFIVSSAACGAASDLSELVVFRIVQAAGAALLTPTSLSMVLATTSSERRHGAVRAWTATAGVAGALGPVVGGLLIAVLGSPRADAATLAAYRHGWEAIALTGVLSAICGVLLLRPASGPASGPAAGPASGASRLSTAGD